MTRTQPTTVARLAVSADALTCVDHVRLGGRSFVDKHTSMTHNAAAASAALKELDILLSLQPHAAAGHVVELRSFRLDTQDQRLHVVMEHCARGDLFHVAQMESRLVQIKLLSAHHGLTTCERSLQRVVFQTLRGLQTLHTNRIAHLDLSLENVFLTNKGDVRIGDFALAQRFQRDDCGRVVRLTKSLGVAKPAYAAPELFSRRPIDDVTKADAWSLGVVVWHLVARSALFPSGAPTPQDPVFRAIVQSTVWIDTLLPQASHAQRDLLVGLLDPNPSTRLSVDAALRHAWFDQLSTPTVVAPVRATAKMVAHEPLKRLQDAAKSPVCGRGRRSRTTSAEISLDATRVAIRPSMVLRRP